MALTVDVEEQSGLDHVLVDHSDRGCQLLVVREEMIFCQKGKHIFNIKLEAEHGLASKRLEDVNTLTLAMQVFQGQLNFGFIFRLRMELIEVIQVDVAFALDLVQVGHVRTLIYLLLINH